MKETDDTFMLAALKLARKGVTRPSSEPLVGALIVANHHVVGRGYTGKEKAKSAILCALDEAGSGISGGTLYLNIMHDSDRADLEAVVERLILSGPARVVVGSAGGVTLAGRKNEGEIAFSASANRHSDSVLARIAAAGIAIETGVCELECRVTNEVYYKYARTGLPFVTVKFAQSLDGRIATATGDSRWISGKASLRLAHQLRRDHDCILVGIGTVLADDPQLTVRLVSGVDPVRVIVDSRLRIPVTAHVLAEGAAHRTIIATTDKAEPARVAELEQLGAEVLILPTERNSLGVDLVDLLAALGRRRIASVLVEGGAGIVTSLLAAASVDRLIIAVAPKIIGRGIESIGDLGVSSLPEAITFSSIKTKRFGADIVFDARLQVAYDGGE